MCCFRLSGKPFADDFNNRVLEYNQVLVNLPVSKVYNVNIIDACSIVEPLWKAYVPGVWEDDFKCVQQKQKNLKRKPKRQPIDLRGCPRFNKRHLTCNGCDDKHHSAIASESNDARVVESRSFNKHSLFRCKTSKKQQKTLLHNKLLNLPHARLSAKSVRASI